MDVTPPTKGVQVLLADDGDRGEQSQAVGCSAHFRDVQMPVEVKSEFIYDP